MLRWFTKCRSISSFYLLVHFQSSFYSCPLKLLFFYLHRTSLGFTLCLTWAVLLGSSHSTLILSEPHLISLNPAFWGKVSTSGVNATKSTKWTSTSSCLFISVFLIISITVFFFMLPSFHFAELLVRPASKQFGQVGGCLETTASPKKTSVSLQDKYFLSTSGTSNVECFFLIKSCQPAFGLMKWEFDFILNLLLYQHLRNDQQCWPKYHHPAMIALAPLFSIL